ncbi:hypothetical protein ACFYWX_03965 [Streptomyces sp. NPDC002888]|uniref:hypothetical protein n=1 Tax=Streptomyces sp. NPDC002888 TaxID=3364668 RepID=UPI0036AD8441
MLDEASAAAAHARRELTLRHPDRFAGLLWYGAVDLDPGHLVVWVLLNGPAEHIPTWHLSSSEEEAGEDFQDLRRLVVQAFEEVGWPNASAVTVGFESAERVAAEGGFHYFR